MEYHREEKRKGGEKRQVMDKGKEDGEPMRREIEIETRECESGL